MSPVKELVSLDDYLAMSFDGVDAELIDGEIVEREMPIQPHNFVQRALVLLFERSRQANGTDQYAELRVKLDTDTVFVPDFCVYRERVRSPVPTTPPWIVCEIISPSESYSRLFYKLDRYREWGVEHIWVIDPDQRRMNVYKEEGLLRVKRFEIPEIRLSIGPEALFDEPS